MTPFETIVFYIIGLVFVAAVIRFTLWATQPKQDTMLDEHSLTEDIETAQHQ